jgi:ADP-ribose pyrophosphatase YjhB (NUDIX family)/predicted RNA-binding Zn-ribbon protein involved in translation (DUF1610 family)
MGIRMVHSDDVNYCERCGHALEEKEFEGSLKPTCPECGFVVFLDPKVAAVVLVSMGDKLVLIKRGTVPHIGEWSFPGGYVDRGEPVEAAARREVKEETGLDVDLTGLIGLYSAEGDPVIIAVYSGRAVGGTLTSGFDTQDAALFELADLPNLAFRRDERILEDWRAALSKRVV